MEVPPNNSSPRDHINRSANQEGGQRGGFVPQSHGGNDYPQQRGSYRKGNGGPHSRGDGSHHHNSYGGRRDQDRVNHDWNPHRNFNREPHIPHQRVVPRGFIRPPPHSSAQFITPPHLRPFGNPILYHGKMHGSFFSIVLCSHMPITLPFLFLIFLLIFFSRIGISSVSGGVCSSSTWGPPQSHAFCCTNASSSYVFSYSPGSSVAC